MLKHTEEPEEEALPVSYRVVSPTGQRLAAQEQLENGVLTITVSADNAILKGTVAGIRSLAARGITEIRFVTNGTQSAFKLADLLARKTGFFALTHEAAQVSFLLDGADISEILK